MFRGIVKFKCESCGTIFEAPDIEDNATVKSYPQRCPKCGTQCTHKANIIDRILGGKSQNE